MNVTLGAFYLKCGCSVEFSVVFIKLFPSCQQLLLSINLVWHRAGALVPLYVHVFVFIKPLLKNVNM